MPDLPFPQWRGEPLAGRSLVVWFEQGLGDEIQFCRYVPLLKARGVSRLTLVCRAPLLPLFQTLSGPDQVVAWSPELALAPHDFCVLPLSLPALFHTTLADLPATVPYLSVSPDRREYWRCRLPADGFRLGLVWRGNSRFENDRHRSLPDLHERIVIVSVKIFDVPYVPEIDRVEVHRLKENFYQVIVQYGFKDDPDIPRALELAAEAGLRFEMLETSFFLGRETLIPRLGSEMAFWREKLFVALFRNAGSATTFFKIPTNRVVELGTQVVL